MTSKKCNAIAPPYWEVICNLDEDHIGPHRGDLDLDEVIFWTGSKLLAVCRLDPNDPNKNLWVLTTPERLKD